MKKGTLKYGVFSDLLEEKIFFGINFHNRKYSPACNVNCALRFIQSVNELNCSNASNMILQDVTFKQLKARIKDSLRNGQYQCQFESVQAKVPAHFQVILTGPSKNAAPTDDHRFFTDKVAAFKKLGDLDFFRSIKRSQYCGLSLGLEDQSTTKANSSHRQLSKTRLGKPYTVVIVQSPNGVQLQLHCLFDGEKFKGVDINNCDQVLEAILLDANISKVGFRITEKALRITNSLKQDGSKEKIITNLLEVGRIARFFKTDQESFGIESSLKIANLEQFFMDIKTAANQSSQLSLKDLDPREWPEEIHQYHRMESVLGLFMVDKAVLFLSKVTVILEAKAETCFKRLQLKAESSYFWLFCCILQFS